MVGRKKDFNATRPVQVGIVSVSAEHDPCVLDLGANSTRGKQLNFTRWLDKGIDPWVRAIAQQLRVFLQGESVTNQTVSHCGYSSATFLEFLVSTGATYAPSELNRRQVEQFIDWLKVDSTVQKISSQRSIYASVKAILKGLARRGLIPRDRTLFPARQFSAYVRDIESEEPISQAERARLAEALRTDVTALHHRPDVLNDSGALVVYALALCLRTGLNTTPMLELRRDALTRHPFLPKMGLLTSYKRRNHRTHWTTLAGEQRGTTAAVPVDAVALFNALLGRTSPLAETAPAALRNVLWLYRDSSNRGRGQLRRLNTGTFHKRIAAFVRRHNLRADDGELLRLNNQRLRVTLESRLWKLSHGDLFTVASLMGHSPKVADQHYLAVTDEMRAHATIVGEALPDIYRGDSAGERPEIANTPVGGCKDSLYGELAPKDGVNYCMDFLSCFRCSSYAVVESDKDLHRLFSFYWFLAAEKQRIASRAWREHFAYLMSLIDAFTLDKFESKLVKRAKRRAKAQPLSFWKNYEMSYGGEVTDAD